MTRHALPAILAICMSFAGSLLICSPEVRAGLAPVAAEPVGATAGASADPPAPEPASGGCTMITRFGPCGADMSGPSGLPDGVVDALDFLRLISCWGQNVPAQCDRANLADVIGCPDGNDDVNNVNALDVLILLAQWGSC